MHTTVVIPCYNEAERLDGDRFVEFVETHPDVSFLLVDDGSTDATAQLLQELSGGHPRLDALILPQNGGKAEAVRQGFLHLLNAEPPDHLGFWDADLATPLTAIPEFVEVLDADPHLHMVIGSRIRLLGRAVHRKALRHYFGRVAATAVSSLFEIRVYDTQCGAKMFRVNDQLPQIFEEPFVTRWVFDVEILVRWRRLYPDLDVHEAVYELPLKKWVDVAGSKIQKHEFLLAPRELARIYRHYR